MAVRRVEERMANSYSPDSDSTTRTLLRRVLDTADFCTPRRRRSARISAQRALLETPSSRRQSTQTKVTARQHFHGARSTGRLVPGQASGHLEEQTPRTLLKNILLTAPQSSIVMPQVMMKPTPAPQVQPSRRESSQGSLELRLPELESPPTLGPVLLGSGRRKQRLRLSMFQQEVDQEPQELPISQEPPGNPDASSLTSSFKLTFATPLQPQSVKRPGLARKPPPRRAIDVGALLQDLRDNSSAPAPLGDSLRIPVATLLTDTVLEDTQPFSHPLVDHSASVYHSLPHPHPGPEDAERAVRHRTQNSSPELQNHRLPPERAAPPEVTEAVTFQRAVEPEEQERSSEYEIISDRPGKRPSVNRSQRAVEPEKSSEDEDMSDRPAKRPSVNRSQRAVEPERSSEDKDISGRPAKRPSVNRSQRAVEPERSSEDEDISDRPGKRPSVNRSQRAVEPERSLEDEDISGRPGKRRSVNRSQGAVEPERSSEDEDISDRPGKRPSVNRSQRALRPEEPERSSEDEDISDRPASSELASNIPEFLQAEQLDQFPEPASPPGVGVLSAEPPEPVLARLPSRPRTAGSRPHQDPHKAGISYYTKLFSFYAKMPMERKALEVVEKCLDKYLQHLCNDLDVFAAHAGRKTVKPADLELLMRRQGLVTDQVSLHVLVEQHLPLEYRQLLIPCAFSGNSVFPAR